ncbi:MAG: hypothetical protein U0521_26495 [Anaerolineae bacterium]
MGSRQYRRLWWRSAAGDDHRRGAAGGASVLALLTSPETDGLFHQAMVLSGGGRQPILGRARTGGTALAPSADQIDSAFAESLGVQAGRVDALTALRALPADDFVEGLDLSAVLTIALTCAGAELQAPANYDPACKPAFAGHADDRRLDCDRDAGRNPP